MNNTLKAIVNIVDNPTYQLMQKYQGRNRINGIGDALERFIQDRVISGKEDPPFLSSLGLGTAAK